MQIIETAGQAVGVVSVEEHPNHIFLAEIQLLPKYQGRGIGTKILQGVLQRSARLKKPLRLQVLHKNDGAKRLYEKLGFLVSGNTDRHYLMEYN